MPTYLETLQKVASTQPPESEVLDLSKISGADLLQGIRDGTIVLPEEPEKTAEQPDISKMSTEELVALRERLSGPEKTASEGEIDLATISAADFLQGLEDGTIVLPEEEVEKTANAEDEAFWAEAGRALGNAFLATVAGEEPGEIDGNMKVADFLTKEAGVASTALQTTKKSFGRKAGEFLSKVTGGESRQRASMLQGHIKRVTSSYAKGAGKGATETASPKAIAALRSKRNVAVAKGYVAPGAAAATVAGGGAYAVMRKKK